MTNFENMQHEDIIWKSIFQLFKDDGLKFFGIEDDIISTVNTENITIDVRKKINDNLYNTNKGYLLHLEFQSSKTKISRFMLADAIVAEEYNKPVRTVVIYSSDVQEAEGKLDYGSLTYTVENFYMIKYDGDVQYEAIRNKIDNSETLTRQDIMTIVLLPLMKHKSDMVDMIYRAIDLSDDVHVKDEQQQIQAMLVILAEKFVTDKEVIKRIKERLSMSAIGQMLIDDGREEGRIEGRREGRQEGKQEGRYEEKIEVIKNLLKESLPYSLIAKATGLPTQEIEKIQREIATV